MPGLVPLLFPAPSLRRDPIAVVRWWESRRVAYNVVVGAAGLVTLGTFRFILFPAEGDIPWIAVAAYGAMANVCYSLGPAFELLIERFVGRDTYGLGPALFRHGLVFSIGLTLFPIGFGVMIRIAQALAGVM